MKGINQDLTIGSIRQKLIAFALPLLLGSLVQQLYNTVDLIFVGNVIGKSASAAIGASTLLITCLIGFFSGMSVGSGVVIAQIYGARNEEKLSLAIHNTAAFCLTGGLVLMGMGYVLAPVFLRLIGTPESIQPAAAGYLRIYFLSFPSVVIYNLGSGVVRALGDSRTPLYAQIAGGLTNVAMDYLFVTIFADGINGVAWATLLSQSVAAVIIVRCLTKLKDNYALRLNKIAFERSTMKEVLRIGLPAGAQSLVITLSNVAAQYHINSLGEDAIAAFTAYFKVELLIYYPIVALGQANMTFSGQNLGAGNLKRVRQGTLQCTLMSIALAVITAAISIPLGGALFRVFSWEESVILLGRQIIGITFPFYPIYSILQIVGDCLRGIGKSRGPMLIIFVNICIIRTVLLFAVVPHWQDIRAVALTYPITWALTSGCMLVYYFRCRQKEDLFPYTSMT